MTHTKTGYFLLAMLAVFALVAVSLLSPITQNTDYHKFSDSESFFGIPNFWNVVSNLPFLIIGIMGLLVMKKYRNLSISHTVFFSGILLVALGSGYYHWQPDNTSLVWDRLPMTVAFMSLLAILTSECIHNKIGRFLLWPLLLLGVFSIYYWLRFNDLRLYLLVQFYPMLAMPVILVFFKLKNKSVVHYWYLLLAYILAKLCEHFDAEIHHYLCLISGHSLKHLLVAIGLFAFTYGLKRAESAPENLTGQQSQQS